MHTSIKTTRISDGSAQISANGRSCEKVGSAVRAGEPVKKVNLGYPAQQRWLDLDSFFQVCSMLAAMLA